MYFIFSLQMRVGFLFFRSRENPIGNVNNNEKIEEWIYQWNQVQLFFEEL